MLNARFRPLEQWPAERTRYRQDAKFRSTYPQTLDLLETELSHLHARAGSVVIQVDNLSLDDIRNDGWPKGSWNPRGGNQGVVVSFESGKGAMSFPCDKFRDWQDNLRAIAKSLEALRMVDRYGVTRGNEQYRGWTQIGNGNGKMDRASALKFMASLHSSPVENLARLSVEELRSICRTAKIENHPDREGGSHETFVAIGQAEEVLCR
jgi:hypothetical protein